MKLFFLTLFMTCATLFAQEPQYMWANKIHSENYEGSRSIEVDSEGKVYSAGYFTGTVDFDPGPGEALLTSVFGIDAYVQKLDENGELVWVKTFGGWDAQEVMDMEIDVFDHITLIGDFRDTIDFDPGLGEAIYYPKGATDVFIVSLDSDGDYRWSKHIGCKSHDAAAEITSDPDGNIMVSLSYRDTLELTIGTDTIEFVPVDWFDIAVLKFNTTGELIWAKTIGGLGQKSARNIISDLDGNVFVSGLFKGTIDADPSESELLFTVDNPFYNDYFVTKLDSEGNFEWAYHTGGNFEQVIERFATDNVGNLYAIGLFQSEVDFNPGPEDEILTSFGSNDCFIQKISPEGEFKWAKNYGSTNTEEVTGIDIGSDRNIYLTGNFGTSFSMDMDDEDFTITSNGFEDVYMMKLNEFGELVWAKTIGGPFIDLPTSIRVDAMDNLYITGTFADTMDFDPGAGIAELNTEEPGDRSIFVAKYSQCASFNYEEVNSCHSYTWTENDSTYTESGIYTILYTNEMGCDSTVQLTLTIDSVNTDIVVEGTTITAVQEGAAYTWVDCNNDYEPIAGEDGISFTADTDGSYAVIISFEDCADTSECVDLLPSGLNENNSKPKLTISPNPLSDFSTITVSEMQDQNLSLIIVNAMGKEVYRNSDLNQNKIKISREQLPAGIYTVILTEDKRGERLSAIKLVVL